MEKAITESLSNLKIHPLTPEHWNDLERLFGPRGACGGCWCMFWRQTRSEFEKSKGEVNHLALRDLVHKGETPGLIACLETGSAPTKVQPVGWIAVAPRTCFSALQRSRVLKPVDDQPVWSIVCFFVDKKFRRRGLTLLLIQAAVDHATAQGARIVEAYPIEPRSSKYADVFAYTGLVGPFLRAGFIEVARRSESRPIMRYYTGGQS